MFIPNRLVFRTKSWPQSVPGSGREGGCVSCESMVDLYELHMRKEKPDGEVSDECDKNHEEIEKTLEK